MVFFTARFGSDTTTESPRKLAFRAHHPANATIPGSDPARLGSETTQTYPPSYAVSRNARDGLYSKLSEETLLQAEPAFCSNKAAVAIQRLQLKLHAIAFTGFSWSQRILPHRAAFPFATAPNSSK